MERALFALLALGSTAASPPALDAGPWHCPVTEALRCDAGMPCVATATNVIIRVDPRAGRFARCWNDAGDCDHYAARFWRRGEQLTAQGLQDGNLVNLSPDLTVTEVSSIGHTVFIYRGRCTAAAGAALRDRRQLPLVTFVRPVREGAAIMLPGSAVLSDSRGTFVFILDDNDQVVRREIASGRTGDRGVVILRGLQGDERVVDVAGAFLTPGEMVRPERAALRRRR